MRNLPEMCLYISGGPALVKTLQFGCMQYRALADYSAKSRLCSLIGEYGDFRILRSLNESQTLDPDIRTLFANFNTRNENARKIEVDFSQFSQKIKSLRLIKFNIRIV